LVELLEVLEQFECVFYEGHDAAHTLGEDGQQQFPLQFLRLVDDAVVEADDDLQELVVAAVLRHVLVQELQRLDDRLVRLNLAREWSTSVKSRMTMSRMELKGCGLARGWLWMMWESSRRKRCLLVCALKGMRMRVRRWLKGLVLLFIM
jgi:hypothetical protein